MKPTCYHYRDATTGNKTVGGTLSNSAKTLDEAAEYVARWNDLSVELTPAGRPVLVSKGKRVNVYLSVDPEQTDKGRAAIAAYQAEKARKAALAVAASDCENKDTGSTCSGLYNCCACGGSGCGCAYCFDCKACDACKAD
jgi:hypothetical protein